jgi:hypothetical protein
MMIVLPILTLVIVLIVLVVMYVVAVKATYGRLDGNFANALTAKSRQAAPAPVVNAREPIETLPVEEDINDDIEASEPEEEYVPAFADDGSDEEADDEPASQESESLPWD